MLTRSAHRAVLAARVRTPATSCVPLRAALPRTGSRGVTSSSSVSSETPSSKISVAPFRVSAQVARERLLMNALVVTARVPNMIYAAALKIFGFALEPIGREFGLGEDLVLKDMKAAYWPIWRVDLVADGPVRGQNSEEDMSATLIVKEGYIPGNAFAPLSYISFAVPPLPRDLHEFSPEHDRYTPEGYDIVQVPFNVPPFALIDLARKAIGRSAQLGPFSLDPTKWKETMAAAYPIMFPIWIAEFEQDLGDEGKPSFTMILDGHVEDADNTRTSAPVPALVREQSKDSYPYYLRPAPFMPTNEFLAPLVEVSSPKDVAVHLTGQPSQLIAKAYNNWMCPLPSKHSVAPSPTISLVDTPIDWSDSRIQSWGGKEHDDNDEYMSQVGHDTLETDLLTLSGMKDGNPGKRRREIKPPWLLEYEKNQAKKDHSTESTKK